MSKKNTRTHVKTMTDKEIYNELMLDYQVEHEADTLYENNNNDDEHSLVWSDPEAWNFKDKNKILSILFGKIQNNG